MEPLESQGLDALARAHLRELDQGAGRGAGAHGVGEAVFQMRRETCPDCRVVAESTHGWFCMEVVVAAVASAVAGTSSGGLERQGEPWARCDVAGNDQVESGGGDVK